MCGILCVVRCAGTAPAPTWPLVTATHIVRHRGPDDEGYLLWRGGCPPRVYAGPETSSPSREARRLANLPSLAEWRVGLGHRRLSILDLSPAGHQPMVHQRTGLCVAYNGEIYNYVDLRRELERHGHTFVSGTDTEVLLAAWAEWGPDCLHRFNGMFAFVLLDPRGGGTLHAVRDRFGVKPLYWARVGQFLLFASECKQIRSLAGFSPRLDRSTARDYLASGLLDHTRYTFDEGIQQLLGGERSTLNLSVPDPRLEIMRWYELKAEPWNGSDADAALAVRECLTDSVRLRLRADVTVGSCLSGGLDSSTIVCFAREALERQGSEPAQVTVTACFEDHRYDEWRFANLVVADTGAHSVRVWPLFGRLQAELDWMLWHMDEPYASTSQFSQWCVFAAAADAGLKVMLDGQGSDEQLAGYGGSTKTAMLTGVLRGARPLAFTREVLALRRERGRLPIAEIILAMRNLIPLLDAVLPSRVRTVAEAPDWLRLDAPSRIPSEPPQDLNASLRRQTLSTSLPALLRYEDRNSMARSIEARVPFLDYRLVELLAGLPDRLKLRGGTTKVVLRDATRGVLPEAVRQRRDKMGFVTPEEIWLRETSHEWFRSGVEAAVEYAPELFNLDRVRKMLDDVVAGRAPFSCAPWRILCMGRWLAGVDAGATATALGPTGTFGGRQG